MKRRFFVCADVLAAVRDQGQGRRQAWAREWLSELWNARVGRISLEVLHELYRRNLNRQDVRALLKWKPVGVERDTVERAWSLQDQYGLDYPSALNVACAEASDCHTLLTETLPDGRFYGRIQVVDPYRHSPHECGLQAAVAG